MKLNEINKDWNDSIGKLDPKEPNSLVTHSDEARALSLFSLVKNKDYDTFDDVVKTIGKQYLYQESVIKLVHGFYIEQDRHEYALRFIAGAIRYFDELGKNADTLIELKRNANKKNMCERLKVVLLHMHDLEPHEVPQVVPDSLNGHFKLHEFILEEIVRGLNIMRNKILAVESIKHENKYNDVMLATLRLRFPIWGWDITDQPRLGKSAAGGDAGEIDVLITATGSNITFIEAFRLEGQDSTRVSDHLIKCYDYVRDVDHYYIVIYFIGEKSKFDKYWKVYLSDVKSVKFPTELEYDKARPDKDITSDYRGNSDMRIATTHHGTGKFMHHIMINLGE